VAPWDGEDREDNALLLLPRALWRALGCHLPIDTLCGTFQILKGPDSSAQRLRPIHLMCHAAKPLCERRLSTPARHIRSYPM
jgi:hypothetical protein